MKTNLLLRKRGGYDELYTPDYAVKPILKYLKPNSTIWCPFDTKKSEYVKVLKAAGHKVINSHIWLDTDFMEYEPEEYDYIISNPPYSIKDKILERLYKLNKPFAMLLPLATLEGIKRGKMFKENGIELLILNKRINFMEGMLVDVLDKVTKEPTGEKKLTQSSYFNTSYFCNKLLDKPLIFHELIKEKKVKKVEANND